MTITVIDIASGEQRKVAEDAPSLQPSLAARRAQAALDRAGFCTALFEQGIVPDMEAVEAARGGWPPSFAAAVAEAGGDDLPAQIAWAALGGRIGRLDALVLALLAWHATAKGMKPAATAALGDRLFGL